MASPLRRLFPYVWRQRRLLIPGLAFALVSAVFGLVQPGVVREAIDAVPRMVAVQGAFAGTPAGDDLFGAFSGALVLVAGLVVVLAALSGLFSYLMRQTVVVASRHLEFDLRGELYEHLQTLSGAFYGRYATGDVMTRATSDIEKVRRFGGPALMYLARAVAAVVSAITVMLLISPALTAWAVLPMPVLAVVVFFVARALHVRTDRQQKAYSSLTSRVQEALAGIRVVKAYAQEEAWARRFQAGSLEYRDRALDLARVDAAFRPILMILIGLSTVIVVGVGGQLVIEGRLSIGNIAEFIIYVSILTWPVASFGYVVSMIQQASASMARIGDVLDARPDVEDTERTDPAVTAVEGAVAFERVSYHYPVPEGAAAGDGGAPLVLRDVSFEVPAGSSLGVVGRTGSGKSTLIEMIPRLIEPTEGRVLVDGRDVREVPVAVLRGAIGYVPQEVFLFSDTVGNNVAFGVPGASDERIVRAADEADLLGNVQRFPRRFDTLVGERGITLSGGQKQRAAIARALVREPNILIFDDALSAVDTRTEATILGNLRRHFGQRTVIVVSHRISAVQDADLILVLEDGEVAERGSHAELVEAGGVYAGMHRKQLLEAELAGA